LNIIKAQEAPRHRDPLTLVRLYLRLQECGPDQGLANTDVVFTCWNRPSNVLVGADGVAGACAIRG
jgi:hypothetical protein